VNFELGIRNYTLYQVRIKSVLYLFELIKVLSPIVCKGDKSNKINIYKIIHSMALSTPHFHFHPHFLIPLEGRPVNNVTKSLEKAGRFRNWDWVAIGKRCTGTKPAHTSHFDVGFWVRNA